MGGDEAGIKRSPDDAGAVQAVAFQPAPAEGIPGKGGLGPLAAKPGKPGAGLCRVANLVAKAPLRRRLIEALRDPLDDYEGAAGSEHVANVVKYGAGIRDVVERKAGDDGIQRGIGHILLEGDPPVRRPVRRLGIDTQGVVAGVKKGLEVAASLPATELGDLGRRLGSCLRMNGQAAVSQISSAEQPLPGKSPSLTMAFPSAPAAPARRAP